MVEPQSIRSIDEPKRVFPTHLSHFSYRRHRRMGFNGKVEQQLTDVADGANRFSLAGLDVEKKRRRRYHPSIRKNRHFGVWYEKNFRLRIFDEESFGQVSSSVLQLSVCFCSCFP